MSGVSLGQEIAIYTNRHQAVGRSRRLPGENETSYTGGPKSKASSQEHWGNLANSQTENKKNC